MIKEEILRAYLYAAYKSYQKFVKEEKTLYERYASLFLEMTDCVIDQESDKDRIYRMNHGRELLLNRRRVAEYYFNKDNLRVEDMQEIIDVINKTKKGLHASEKESNGSEIQKIHLCMTETQLASVVDFANDRKIFKETLTPELLQGFFSEKKTELHAAENIRVAMFLDSLKVACLVSGLSNKRIERRANLISSSDKKPLLAHDLSAALHHRQGTSELYTWHHLMIAIAGRD